VKKVQANRIIRDRGSGLGMLRKATKTLAKHCKGIVAYYGYSTGAIEGTNIKFKTMKRQAYDFWGRNFLNSKSWPCT
jgi:transposase